MTAIRKIAAILAADVVGFSRLTSNDEDDTLARLRTLRSEHLEPTVAAHRGRIFKWAGDGLLAEFRSVIDAVRCALEVQGAMPDRNSGLPAERCIAFRVGVHLGEIVEEVDGDLMGEGVNIAARLEGIAEPGAICLSEDAHRQVRGKLDLALTDLGPTRLKNIADPIQVYLLRVAAFDRHTFVTARSDISSARFAVPDKASIAVLPFQNMSGDAEQEYFADGVVEDIVTGLSRIKWLFVIARNSSFTYKGKAIDVRQVGRELGVRYVLEGGVRRSGGRLRVSAQLVEAKTGVHLWADRYEGSLEDVFDFQDRITDRVVGIIEPILQRSEVERSRQKRPGNLNAYDLYLRALPHTATQMPESAATAIKLLNEALALDPNYAAAHALSAWCHEWCFARAGFDETHRTKGLNHARSVIVSSTDDAAALAIAGFVIVLLSGDREVALSAVERALAFNPSCATALYLAAQIHSFAGHSRQAVEYANRALRLSPFDLLAYEAYLAKGQNAVLEERFDEAASHFSMAVQSNPGNGTNYLLHAIGLALAGRTQEAFPAVQRGLELEPAFRARWFHQFSAHELADRLVRGAQLLALPI